jgi:hypothetical protein
MAAVDATELNPFARIMVSSYLATSTYSRTFDDEWGSPPTTAAKAHHFRSVVQAQVTDGSRYELQREYVEFGRVQVTDTESARAYLIRSMSAVGIENARPQLGLFPIPTAYEVNMLVYQFEQAGMRLWRCGTTQAQGRRRLVPSGELLPMGFWPFDDFGPDGGTFDQGSIDPFPELGDLDIEGTGSE